jgi:hypothetical protein
MGRRLYTESCVRELPAGSELVLGRDALATPSALELAFARGIRVRYGDGTSTPAAPAADAGLAALLRDEGEYVVHVQGGRARVFRLGAGGPVLVGEARA